MFYKPINVCKGVLGFTGAARSQKGKRIRESPLLDFKIQFLLDKGNRIHICLSCIAGVQKSSQNSNRIGQSHSMRGMRRQF
jgi:hypothetical protein